MLNLVVDFFDELGSLLTLSLEALRSRKSFSHGVRLIDLLMARLSEEARWRKVESRDCQDSFGGDNTHLDRIQEWNVFASHPFQIIPV